MHVYEYTTTAAVVGEKGGKNSKNLHIFGINLCR